MIFPKPGDRQPFTTQPMYQRFLRADQGRQGQISLACIVGSTVERGASRPDKGRLEASEFAERRRSQVQMQGVRGIRRWRRKGGKR
jgi:hypothetical protein